MDFLTTSIGDAIAAGISAGIIIYIFIIAISLAVFCLYVAVGTWVVKKVWFSNWGGNPRKYR